MSMDALNKMIYALYLNTRIFLAAESISRITLKSPVIPAAKAVESLHCLLRLGPVF